MFKEIKSDKDIKEFLDKTNSLHDGYIIGVQYENKGISKTEYAHYFDSEKTGLRLRILVTSISDAIVEIEFEDILKWQIKDNQSEITDTSVIISDQRYIIWSDDVFSNTAELDKGSFVIAKSMKWRIAG